MELYVIRHADAGKPEGWDGDDATRPLTSLGHQQATALGEAFRQQGLSVDAVLTSPLTRTMQTATDFQAAAAPDGPPPQPCDWLAPDSLRRRKLSKDLAELGVGAVAIVGHNPDLQAYLAWLLGTEPEQIHLEKGAVALVQFESDPDKGKGTLAWIVTPGWYLAHNPAELAAV